VVPWKQLLLAFALVGPFTSAVPVAAADAPQAGTPGDILVSRQLMRDAHLSVGAVVVLATDAEGTRTARFRVVGVYEPVPDPMKFNVKRFEARLHLPDLVGLTADPGDPQALEAVTAINVALVDPAAAARFAADVSRRSIGVTVRPVARARDDDPFAALDGFHKAIAAVTVVGSTAFLLALMVIRAEERREMVGMLRLVGVPSGSIVRAILIEGLVVAVAGAAFGVALGVAGQYGINRFFQARYDTPLLFVRVTASIAIRCLAVAVPVGVLTGAVASWTLLRRPPTEAMGR
jgi:hypothetical protein